MLNRLSASLLRSWTRSSYRRVSVANDFDTKLVHTNTFATEAPSQDDNVSLANIVQRKLKTVRSSLSISDPLKVPSIQELEKWKDAIKVGNLDAAVKTCGERLLTAPNWVLLYLLSSKVHTPTQAVAAVNVMLDHFPRVDKVLQPALLILAIRFLARQQVEIPVPNLIKLFLILDIPDPPTQFNLLLRCMSHFKPSPVLAKATTQVLDAMHGRQIKLHSRTYRTLLSNSLVSLELAKNLQQRMELEGTKPNRHHLEAYLRVFAHHGAVHGAARYLNLIREHAQKEDELVPYGVELSSQGAKAVKSPNSVNTRWNTKFLASFKRDSGTAFQYLREMVDDKDVAPIPLRTVRKESRIGPASRKNRPLVWKHKTHVSDWATVLNVAARDRRISSNRLLRLFDETRAAAGYPPTVAIFTVLIRGLARKGDYATALEVWERCCASWSRRRKIDTKALTVAMEVIVGAGYPLVAFDTLVETTGVLHDWDNPPPKLSNSAIGRRYKRALWSKYAKIDVPLVNALMNAYQKNGRPDLVFRLWDVFYPLFGVHPNANTLTIVLDAAYSVARWDHTFRGLLEHLGLHDLFKSASRSTNPLVEENRNLVVQQLRATIQRGSSPPTKRGGERDGIKPDSKEVAQEAQSYMRKTLWNGELAAPKAIKLFQEILLGNFPELMDVVAPARAIWPDEARSASPMRDALSSLGSRLRGTGHAKPKPNPDPDPHPSLPEQKPLLMGPSLLLNRSASPSPNPTSTSFPLPSPHPQITPTKQTFTSYLNLLFITHRPSQIALTLAWMHALHITPSRRPLAIAIALWSEASMRGPLIDQLHTSYGLGGESEFSKLMKWLEGWLEKEGMPSDAAISWAFRKLKAEREKW